MAELGRFCLGKPVVMDNCAGLSQNGQIWGLCCFGGHCIGPSPNGRIGGILSKKHILVVSLTGAVQANTPKMLQNTQRVRNHTTQDPSKRGGLTFGTHAALPLGAEQANTPTVLQNKQTARNHTTHDRRRPYASI